MQDQNKMTVLNINSVLFQTVILGIVSVYFIKRTSKTFISASFAYWFGWSFLLFGAIIAINNNWIHEISGEALYYITQLNYGSFIGFFLGTIFSPSTIKNRKYYPILVNHSEQIIDKVSNNLLIILFLLGLLFLMSRISRVGLNSNYLENVRGVYAEGKTPFIARIATHLSMIVSFLIIMQGVRDSKYGIDIKMLVKIILASSPLGLANGNRIFLLSYLMLYTASLVICRGAFGKHKFLLAPFEWRKSLILFSSVLLIFAIIGFVRGGYGEHLNIIFTIFIWPVSTIMAMNDWISVALSSHSTMGLFTFGWFIEFLNRIGILDYSKQQQIVESAVIYFKSVGDPAAFIPKSIIPELIFDFGSRGVFWGGLFVSLFLQIATLRFVAKGLFLHTFAVLCLVGAFMTIQRSVFSPEFIAILFWAAMFSLWIKFKDKKIILIK